MLTRGAQVTGVAVCSLCLTWISCSLRGYVRLRILKFFGREDWLTVASLVLFTILCALLLEVVNYGLGAHQPEIPLGMLTVAAKYIFTCELLYVATTAVTKVSIGVFFLRLASKRYQIFIIYIVMAVVMVYSSIYFFFVIFQCKPVSYLWTQYTNGEGSCLSVDILANVTYAHAAMSAITDWALGILPIFFVRKMKMNPRTKISVILILSLGFFASTATIVRIVYIRALTLTDDYSWEGINLVKWSMVEPAIGITAAAIATLRPLFNSCLHRKSEKSIMSSTDAGSTTTSKVRPSIGQDEYNSEFADMLGLRRIGVTTLISASPKNGSGFLGLRRKRPSANEDTDRFRPRTAEMDCSSSQTELNRVGTISAAGDETPPVEFDWNKGIRMTTVTTFHD